VCALARQAGEKITRFYHKGASVTCKKDRSPLTAADEASHAFLVKSLQELLPEAPVVSEESEGAIDRSIGHSTVFWLVDPLDGTKEFVKRTIALMEGQAAVLGVVHAQALNITYYGGREFGAWYQAEAEPPRPFATRRADPSQLAVVASRTTPVLWLTRC
jgi:3'(2'), 5'-bisphosphate nucleotidase